MRFQHVSIGNPQCAIHVAGRRASSRRSTSPRSGRTIEHAPLFPNRTNVSFWTRARRRTRSARGSSSAAWGRRCRSGTGACGAAVAHVLRGGDSPVTVRLDGGELDRRRRRGACTSTSPAGRCPVYRGRAERRADAPALGQELLAGDEHERSACRRAWADRPGHHDDRGRSSTPGTRSRGLGLDGAPRRAPARARSAPGRAGRRVRAGGRPAPTTCAACASSRSLAVVEDLDAPPRRRRTTPTCACTCSRTGSSRPHELNLDGVFGRAAPTSPGRAAARSTSTELDAVRLRCRARRAAARASTASTSSRA